MRSPSVQMVVYIGADAAKTALVLQALRERRARTTVWIAGGVSAAATRSMFAAVLPNGPIYSSGDAIDVAETASEYECATRRPSRICPCISSAL